MPEAAWARSSPPVHPEKSYPHVAMMQSGQDLCGDDGHRSLDAAKHLHFQHARTGGYFC